MPARGPGPGRANVFSIPAGAPFAQTLAEGVIAREGRDPLRLADVQIYVPTRRAARTLRDAFARALSGASLGPRIHALGDIDEDDDGFDPASDDLELLPAIAPLRRKLLLANLVQRWALNRGESMGLAQAASHADALAGFLDEASSQRVDLSALKDLVPDFLAAHWQEVTKFLAILSEGWPAMLTAEGAMEPATRRDALLLRLSARLQATPPDMPVIAAGSTGSIPATAELLHTIASLEKGAVLLPGLDMQLDGDAWDKLDAAHAQYGLRHLLRVFAVEREDVRPWPLISEADSARAARERFLSEALRPPPTTDSWRALIESGADFTDGLRGLSLLEAANAREEAQAIAVALRDAAETPGRSAALVTPDRGLGRRVAAELSRWDIAIDDSAGQPLARTPPGAFLCLLAEAASERFAPVPLLALLKHPLSAGGENRASFRAHVRELERACLRGLRPDPGLPGIALALAKKDAPQVLIGWFARLCEKLAAFAEMVAAREATLASLCEAHGRAAEALAASDDTTGAAELWRGPAGESAASLMADMLRHSGGIAIEDADQYAELFRDLAEARAVRPPFGLHPRLFILGPLEARLQHFDLTILGGLNENSWPANAAIDPWLSRPMRKDLGLEAPERRIGLAAHDFASLANGPEVLLTRALKQDGAPTIASRWWLRCVQLAKGLKLETILEPGKPYLDWTRALDDAPHTKRAHRPRPTPPVSARPRQLSITEIETWQRDPYAIYAKHVLGLKPLDAIDLEPGPRERGTAIHAALEKFLTAYPEALPDDALLRLKTLGEEAFQKAGATPALLALWRPRFARASAWFLAYEKMHRAEGPRIMVESKGELQLSNGFTLRGRADRIDILSTGAAAIYDYKTGRVPGHKEVAELNNPQLPLEAAMLLQGAFADVSATHVEALIYLQLGGGDPPGEERILNLDPGETAGRALALLNAYVTRYAQQTQGYLSRVKPFSRDDEGDYDHLARVREWLMLGEEP